VLLGFLRDSKDLRRFKQTFLCSNTRNVYKRLQDDVKRGITFPRVAALANQIDATRLSLGKTSGFEKLYGEVVRRYFGGMARHLEELNDYRLKAGGFARLLKGGIQPEELIIHRP
jgi:hypothetical protein